MENTIAAISTALGVGAISIIRVSGPDAIENVNKIWKGKDLRTVSTHTIHYGHIIENEEIIDEVLVTIMHSPKTFTTEDTVEINCHGSIATTQKILELLYQNGCSEAQPGEFTKRAFLNGRIDLLEAESVMDLIESKTDQTRKMALNQLQGKVSNLIHELRQKIVNVLANIEVNIDYPEYEDIEEMTLQKLQTELNHIEVEIQNILKASNEGKLMKEGIKTAIIGRPNVGKSSLLNTLLEEDKAIVTEIEGTTRDTVEGIINLEGLLLNIIDTAGIRNTQDIVEKIGVEKSKKLLDESDLILYMVNQNECLTLEDQEMINHLQDKTHIVIINKIDLESKIDLKQIQDHPLVKISTLTKVGIEDLKHKIKELFHLEQIETKDLTYLTNARGIAILKNALHTIAELKEGIQNLEPIDMLEIDLKELWQQLGEIIGESYQEELIDQLFQQFCLGK